jgi:hypothetical protein
MKRILNLIGVIGLLCVLSPVGSSGSTLGESYVLFGFDEYGYNYSEDVGSGYAGNPFYIGIPRSDEYGTTSAFHAEGKYYSKTSGLYGGFLFEYGGGIQTYNGTPMDSFNISPTGDTLNQLFPSLINTKSNTFTRIGGFIGPYFNFGNCLLGLNAGLLYYNWYRGAGAYNESYTWVYLPIGAEFSFNLNERLTMGFDLQYRIMLSNSMQPSFDYETIVKGIPTSAPQLSDSTRDGFYLGIPIRLQINRQFGIEWKPWFEFRPSGATANPGVLEQSGSTEMSIFEPDSKSYSIGLSISAMFGNFSSFDRAN